MIYKWARGMVAQVDAKTAAETFAQIAEEHDGAIRAEHVVDASRPAEAPLHKCFEWDDSLAAEAYRRDQAQHLIRHVIVISDDEQEPSEYRAFVNVVSNRVNEDDDTGKRIYIATKGAMAEPNYREQVLQQALKELASWRRRYQEYKELAELFTAIDAIRVQETAAIEA